MDYCDDVVVLMFQGADYTVSLAADFASLRSGASSDRIRSRLNVLEGSYTSFAEDADPHD